VLASAGIEVVKIPPRSPRAKRFRRTLGAHSPGGGHRPDAHCRQRHLSAVLDEYAAHYNQPPDSTGNHDPGTAAASSRAGRDSPPRGHDGRDGGGSALRDHPAAAEREDRRQNNPPACYLGRPATVWITAMRPRRSRTPRHLTEAAARSGAAQPRTPARTGTADYPLTGTVNGHGPPGCAQYPKRDSEHWPGHHGPYAQNPPVRVPPAVIIINYRRRTERRVGARSGEALLLTQGALRLALGAAGGPGADGLSVLRLSS
jgi:hypothetical protein